MYNLAADEQVLWKKLAGEAFDGKVTPRSSLSDIRSALRAHFHFYMGGLFAGRGDQEKAGDWFKEGALEEDGIIGIDRHRIIVKDKAALEEMVESSI
jgi:hypothetical protein